LAKSKPAHSRKASCACREFSIELAGDPQIVSACNCTQCQRRTGSAFGISAFFEKSQLIAVTGDKKVFERGSDSGRPLSLNFCPTCGTTLYWELEMLPHMMGVAVGCFADPSFPAPSRAVWCETAHEWMKFPSSVETSPRSAVPKE